MIAAWQTRQYREADLEAVASFLRPLGGEAFLSRIGERPGDYYRWKYSPGREGAGCTRVAFADGRIAGVVASIPRRVLVRGEIVPGAEMGDFLTAPDQRHQGIFLTLAGEVLENLNGRGCGFVYVKPNANSTPALLRHLGFRPLLTLETWARPLQLSRLVASRFRSELLGAMARPFDPLLGPSRRRSEHALSRIEKFNDEFDQLWAEVSPDYPILCVRDRSYLNWRFEQNPTPYVILTVRGGGGRLRGYAVALVVHADGRRVGCLVDLLIHRDDREAATSLVRGVLAVCKDAGAEVVYTWIIKGSSSAQSALRYALRRQGFLRRWEDGPVLWRSLALWKEKSLGESPADSYFTVADFDGI